VDRLDDICGEGCNAAFARDICADVTDVGSHPNRCSTSPSSHDHRDHLRPTGF
jgi:hypothetical protein